MAAREVSIRMYRQGLGDCFLLSFPKGGKRFHMLIDCGALVSSSYTPESIRTYVADIKKTTKRLDVVVGTHEHWDHISGFSDAVDVFKQFDVDQVWVAWTEEPGNAAAEVLRKEFKKQKQAVETALRRLPDTKKSEALALYEKVITDLFGFFGGLGAKGGVGKTEQAWKNLLGLGRNVYCDPKDHVPKELDGVSDVRLYILGPPEDPAAIRKKLSKAETYHEDGAGLTLTDTFLAALASKDPGGEAKERRDRAMPMEERHRIPVTAAAKMAFFKTRYGFDEGAADEWRRIDHDWLTVAGELALHLDSYTNNTCLAFAIELGLGGDVLLFPGDAQVGNWLSWCDRTWSVKGKDGKQRTVTFDDLLARTVFYKVGHHGSHNATMRAKGLEKMVHPGLVAMIPVHRPTAKQQDWQFPYPPLWKRLKERARCRVILADAKNMSEIEADVRKQLSDAEWKKFERMTTFEKLYVEHRIAY